MSGPHQLTKQPFAVSVRSGWPGMCPVYLGKRWHQVHCGKETSWRRESDDLGVCFRMYSEDKGERLGLCGWVKNTSRGTVVGQVQGPPDKVKEMKVWLSKGGALLCFTSPNHALQGCQTLNTAGFVAPVLEKAVRTRADGRTLASTAGDEVTANWTA
ncbi:hypothetical protein GJAV_G00243690 [Gymnothorax javanicus]|nr:hypothetical protein GJAV_G00243690 [Gymnothorax javanicus]